jgi:molybdopterin-containing oxidoreductase family membrane subunit
VLVVLKPPDRPAAFFHNLTHNMHGWRVCRHGRVSSFFHQGSLGGVSGVLYGRPFGFRTGLLVWPWTFFLYTWSAAACGPCFTLFITRITEMATRKKLVKDNVVELLAKIAGWMLLSYIVAKIIDTAYWAAVTAPAMGFTLMDFYSNNPGSAYGLWILIAEVGSAACCRPSCWSPRHPEQPERVHRGDACGHRRLPEPVGDGAAGSGRAGAAV